jgi:beta-glucosidase
MIKTCLQAWSKISATTTPVPILVFDKGEFMKASQQFKTYKNPGGPDITSVNQPVLFEDGLYFKDIDRSGKLKPFSDWRLSADKRAKALVKEMSNEEKIGHLFITSRNPKTKEEELTDESGLLNESDLTEGNIFAGYTIPGTTDSILKDHMRNFILRYPLPPKTIAAWIDQLQAVAEKERFFIPVLVASNSRNENGKEVFGMNDAVGTLPTWPGTLGLGAAVLGSGYDLIDTFGKAVRREWDAMGMKKGYMYMVDAVTDPRWQRIYGTFGESPEVISKIAERLVPAIQGKEDGLARDGVAMTIKHWPGGGARENGFDPHYKEGQWNVYATKDSLKDYHLPGFMPAIHHKVSSIMPYYAKPAKAKSAVQHDLNGREIEWMERGFAFNNYFIQDLLRDEAGFTGYVNSDSGIIDNMGWGVETLDRAERIALAVNTGVDMISESYGVEYAKEAMERAENGYYETHPVPEGYTVEQITLSQEALDRALTRTLTEKFELGLFENPYRDEKQAEKIVMAKEDFDAAMDAHHKSAVLLKNKNNALPLAENTKVYIEGFDQSEEASNKLSAKLQETCKKHGIAAVPAIEEADAVLFFLSPSSGNYFSATKGLLEIDLCDGKTVCDFSEEGLPLQTTHEETTLFGLKRLQETAEKARAMDKKVIASVNITMPWILQNIEPYVDGLLAGFDTYESAILDVIFGRVNPTGKLPLTLPKNDAVIAVNEKGICISPNDVPGFAKDKYLPEELLDENGKGYAYKDEAGSYYAFGFGLNY